MQLSRGLLCFSYYGFFRWVLVLRLSGGVEVESWVVMVWVPGAGAVVSTNYITLTLKA